MSSNMGWGTSSRSLGCLKVHVWYCVHTYPATILRTYLLLDGLIRERVTMVFVWFGDRLLIVCRWFQGSVGISLGWCEIRFPWLWGLLPGHSQIVWGVWWGVWACVGNILSHIPTCEHAKNTMQKNKHITEYLYTRIMLESDGLLSGPGNRLIRCC